MTKKGFWQQRLQDIDVPVEEALDILACAYMFMQIKQQLALDGNELEDVAPSHIFNDAQECIDAAEYILEPIIDFWDDIGQNLSKKK